MIGPIQAVRQKFCVLGIGPYRLGVKVEPSGTADRQAERLGIFFGLLAADRITGGICARRLPGAGLSLAPVNLSKISLMVVRKMSYIKGN